MQCLSIVVSHLAFIFSLILNIYLFLSAWQTLSANKIFFVSSLSVSRADKFEN